MMKADEVKLLDVTIARLGTNSYLGPWLAEIRDELVAGMTSDIMPEPQPMLPSKARQWAAGFMEQTKADALKTREAADAYAAETRRKAHEYADSIRREARRALESLATKL